MSLPNIKAGDSVRCIDVSPNGRIKVPFPTNVDLKVERVSPAGGSLGIVGYPGYWGILRFQRVG